MMTTTDPKIVPVGVPMAMPSRAPPGISAAAAVLVAPTGLDPLEDKRGVRRGEGEHAARGAAGERLELERVKQEIERDQKLAEQVRLPLPHVLGAYTIASQSRPLGGLQRVVAEKERLEKIMIENVKERKIREAAKLKQWEEDQKMMREYKEKVTVSQLTHPSFLAPLTHSYPCACGRGSLTRKRSSGTTQTPAKIPIPNAAACPKKETWRTTTSKKRII